MAPTDEQGRIRVVLPGGGTAPNDFNSVYGWATSAPGNGIFPAGGYTVEWDDGWNDNEFTRYFFGDDVYDIKAV